MQTSRFFRASIYSDKFAPQNRIQKKPKNNGLYNYQIYDSSIDDHTANSQLLRLLDKKKGKWCGRHNLGNPLITTDSKLIKATEIPTGTQKAFVHP